MRVAAKQQFPFECRTRADLVRLGERDAFRPNILQQVLEIARPRPMNQQDLSLNQPFRRQRAEPGELAGVQKGSRGAIAWTHLF